MRPYTDGDLVRMVATGTMIVLVCYVAAWLAPLIVEMTDRAGAGLAEGSVFTVALAGDS